MNFSSMQDVFNAIIERLDRLERALPTVGEGVPHVSWLDEYNASREDRSESVSTPTTTVADEDLREDTTGLTPGKCYLHLCVPSQREACSKSCKLNPTARVVKNFFEEFPSYYSPGTFQAILGTAYGTQNNMVKHAGINPVDRSISRLSAKEVLFAIPDNYTIGGDVNVALPDKLINSAPVSRSAVRRYVKSGCTRAEQDRPSMVSLNVYSHVSVEDLCEPWPTVTASDLEITINPTAAAKGQIIQLTYGFCPATDTVPNQLETILNFPIAERRVLIPLFAEGVFSPFKLPNPIGEGGITALVKPRPNVGGAPVLVLYMKVLTPALSEQTRALFEIDVSVKLSIGI